MSWTFTVPAGPAADIDAACHTALAEAQNVDVDQGAAGIAAVVAIATSLGGNVSASLAGHVQDSADPNSAMSYVSVGVYAAVVPQDEPATAVAPVGGGSDEAVTDTADAQSEG